MDDGTRAIEPQPASGRPRLGLLVLLAWALPASLALAEPLAPPGKVVVHIDGMVCNGCQKSVTAALNNLDFLDETRASFAVGGACASVSGEGDADRIREVVAGLGYTVTGIETAAVCPTALRKGHRVDPWDGAEGLDVVIISRGERVDIEDNLVADKFTVIDFGAPWCGPCHTSAATLSAYLADHDDTAVRAITLDEEDPYASYALPVAEQHLKFVAGIPYFMVYAPSGKVIYRGAVVEGVIEAIDKKRSRG